MNPIRPPPATPHDHPSIIIKGCSAGAVGAYFARKLG